MRRSYWIVLFLVISCFAAVQLTDWWKNRHLITLDVTNAEILPVLKEVSRQSGVPVLASTNTTGKVTVQFHRVTLDQALNILAEQTDGRWQKLFLMGRTDSAIQTLRNNVSEQGPPFLLTSAGGGGNVFGATMFAESITNAPPQLSFDIKNKDRETAALEIALRIRTPIVLAPEEGVHPMLNLTINEPTPEATVAKLAQAVNYNLELACHFRTSNRGDGMAMMRNWNRDDGDSARPSSADDASREARAARREAREQMMEKQIALLPPDQQQQYQQARDERQKRMAEFATLSPEERQRRMAEMAANGKAQERYDNRALSRIKNLTPEQRVQRYQKFAKAHGSQAGK